MTFQFQTMFQRSRLPMLATPVVNSSVGVQQASTWLQHNSDILLPALHDAGAVLFRNIQLHDARDFRMLCQSLSTDLRNYIGGDSPRTEVDDQVYTSTEYPSQFEIRLHNELCYADWCPQTLFFGCLLAPDTGGETHLGDGRQIFKRIDPVIRGRFMDRGIKYLQVLRDAGDKSGAGKTWQATFETNSREVVEWRLNNSHMSYQWTDHGLKTSAVHDAVIVHPETGQLCWHNQADHWHRDLLSIKDETPGSTSDLRSALSGTLLPGHHVTYGDDTEIAIDDLLHIRSVASQCEVLFPWQAGDLLIIDNTLTLHGRKPFSGPRKILVAMA